MIPDDGVQDDGVILRACQEADLPAVTAIYAHAVATGRASFELEPPDEAEMGRRRAALVAGGHPYLVAERDGAVVAYAYAGPYRTRPAYRGTVETSVYVRPDQAGRGLGRRLLGRLIAEATAAGFRQMVAVIGDSQNAASIRLHAALGFDPVGVLRSVGWKHGTWLDTVLMQRALGAGDATPPDDRGPSGPPTVTGT
ncbi:GNAT family N-acetyltransferase [Methylobacterium nonmethylotrophicum]|uniref:N-acetyltransferase family protein n=1 Tax=Methylobacterium nonmethylotrophicum TaxID=1141884 RepID=A0A4Z0NJ28_9HYPH|nr:GNAT family N-acetyltransferase [Methylobacterium nonmethylotrophicum]TGD95819.1 N-acetyltransferase family protein [Methylobacterium nonmethylotrophicum]